MTIKQALETINGAEIMSINIPIRKLQSAVLSLMSAAKRCMKYDEDFRNGELERVVRCCDCVSCKVILDNVGAGCWHCKKRYGFPEVDPTDFCSQGERRDNGNKA